MDLYMTFPNSHQGNLDPLKFNLQGKLGSEPAVKCVIITALSLVLHQFVFNYYTK